MSFISALFLNGSAYLDWPTKLLSWLGLVFYFGVIAAMVWRWHPLGKKWAGREWGIFAGLFILQILATLFAGIRLPLSEGLPTPGLLVSSPGPALMVFAAVPWMMAAGLLGTSASTGLAMLAGLLIAYFDTHQVFTILDYALMGVLMGGAVNQLYRTRFYQLIRHPMIASLGILTVYPGIYIFGILLGLRGELPLVLDYALTHVGPVTLAVALTLMLGSGFAEVIVVGFPDAWGRKGPLEPSPSETSLEIRSFYLLGPTVFLMVGILAVIGWNVANRATHELLEERMMEIAETTAQSVPLAVEVGHSLILQLAANDAVKTEEGIDLADWLVDQNRLFPYFQTLLVFDATGILLASSSGVNEELALQEKTGISLALEGVPFQFYVVGENGNSNSAKIAFIAKVDTEAGEVSRVIVGRSELATNPFALNIISSLNGVNVFGGEGFLVDEQGFILYHPDPSRVMTAFSGEIGDEPEFYVSTGLNGVRNLVYVYPAFGYAWTVVVLVPAQAVQQLAIQIAAPLLGLLLLLAVALIGIMRVTLGLVTGSLRSLAHEAKRIATDREELGTPLNIDGMDEVGQMRLAFEQMRMSLKTYLDEREQNLLVAKVGEERLSAILESTPDPVLVTDAQNRLLLANSVAKQVFGNGTSLGEGIPIEEVISQQEIVKLLEAAEDEILTQEITLPDGRVYVAKAKSVMTEDKRRMGQVCVLRDVTRFKELDTLKSDFVSTVSHDLRSPLTLVRGYATMIQVMGQLNDEQVKYLRRIEHGVDRMATMVNSLLDLGRIEAGIGLKLEQVSILEIVKQVVSNLQYHGEQKQIQIESHYSNEVIPSMQADPSLLSQAVHNLVENAIKYTEQGGKVYVVLRFEQKESTILLEIRDTGIGISPKDQLHLFEKFYRVPNKKTASVRGTGLGLAIVKSIVELHKGQIWVQSELDKGSSFFVRLPLDQSIEK